MKMVHNIPLEFKDEDKWFRFFSKKNLIVIIICEGVIGILFKLIQVMNISVGIPFIIVGEGITVILTALTMIPIGETMYLKGGGQTISTVLAKRIYRRARQVIYVKGYGKDNSGQQ